MQKLQFWPQNSEGYLLDLSSAQNINPIYHELILNINNACLNLIGESNIVSTYLIGSITTGKATPGISDADVIVLIKDGYKLVGDLSSELKTVETNLADTFPVVSKVSIKVKYASEMRNGKEVFRSFLIKTQGLCIFGDDIKTNLPNFKPNSVIALPKIQKLIMYIEEAEKSIQDANKPEHVEIWSRKIFKVILRTCALMVMENENQYSNDPYTCLQIFLKYYSSYSEPFNLCLHFIENPTSNKKEILNLLKKVKEITIPLQEQWLKDYYSI